MLRRVNLRILLVVVLALLIWSPAYGQSANVLTAQLQVISVDPADHPRMDVMVMVRDSYGRGVKELRADNFVIEDEGRTIPSELIEVAPADELPDRMTLAIVADLSTLFSAAQLTEMRDDMRALIEQVTDHSHRAVEVALFVPNGRAASSEQPILELPFTDDQATALAALDDVAPRTGQTEIYDAVIMAINASADRAIARGGPAYVVVLSDGRDQTSIAGSDIAGANEAARAAEDQHVRVFTLGYGNTERGNNSLAQVADRTGGEYHPGADPEAVAGIAQDMLRSASGGGYRLRYTSSLEPDGDRHTLSVRVTFDNLTLSAEQVYLLPCACDSTTPTQLDLRVDTQQYPLVTLWVRPLSHLRRTVPELTAQDFELTFGDAALDVPLQVTTEALDAQDPAATQSIAVVAEQHGAATERLRAMTVAFFQEADLGLSRMALFVPGVSLESPQFTHDHNALINALNQITARESAGGSTGATLLSAIDAVARDGDAAQRPAHVVLFTAAALTPEEQARVLTLAQDQGVTIHAVTLDSEEFGPGLERLARSTQGTYLAEPAAAELTGLAQQVAQDQGTLYRITFESPVLADGQPRDVGLRVGDVQATAPVTPLIAGPATVQAPVSLVTQIMIAALVALVLVGAIVAPRSLRERRLRCPTCGKIRRANWGSSCLFCDYDALNQPVKESSADSLEGFALQGASFANEAALTNYHQAEQPVAQEQASEWAFDRPQTTGELDAERDVAKAVGSDPHHAEPALPEFLYRKAQPAPAAGDEADAGLVQAPRLPGFLYRKAQPEAPVMPSSPAAPDHADWEDAPSAEAPVQPTNDADQAEVTTPTPAEQSRVQAHSDFWGALPDDPPAPAQSARDEDELEAAPLQPPPLPVFDYAPPEAAPATTDPPPFSASRENTHTDFWGPLPEAAPATTDPPPFSASSAEETMADPNAAETAWAMPFAARQPADGAEADASFGANPPAHTDFWGPLPSAESGPTGKQSDPTQSARDERADATQVNSTPQPERVDETDSSPEPAEDSDEADSAEKTDRVGSHTDFWGPLAPAPEQTDGSRR